MNQNTSEVEGTPISNDGRQLTIFEKAFVHSMQPSSTAANGPTLNQGAPVASILRSPIQVHCISTSLYPLVRLSFGLSLLLLLLQYLNDDSIERFFSRPEEIMIRFLPLNP